MTRPSRHPIRDRAPRAVLDPRQLADVIGGLIQQSEGGNTAADATADKVEAGGENIKR